MSLLTMKVNRTVVASPSLFRKPQEFFRCHAFRTPQQQFRLRSFALILRYFGTTRGADGKTTHDSDNPYRILNVPLHSNYETVKQAFLKAALKHHPDHSKHSDTAAFVRIRRAFEAIVIKANNNNDRQYNQQASTAGDRHGSTTGWQSEAEFQEWFRAATNEFLSFAMNHSTRQEVIHAYRTMSPGGKDKGGYWEMARQLAEREDKDRTTTPTEAVDVGGGGGKSTRSVVLTGEHLPASQRTHLRRKRQR